MSMTAAQQELALPARMTEVSHGYSAGNRPERHCHKCGVTCYTNIGDKIQYGTIYGGFKYRLYCLDCYEELPKEIQDDCDEYTDAEYDCTINM